ncbi:MAG: DUF1802 family protein [Planctomycetia bacterium]|nr:DUF1802 family protein [Planctomycetia bacterium]
MDKNLNIGLKEWAVVCDAVLAGRQAILLRKGGIYEAAGEFELEQPRFVLCSTLVHQRPESIKPAWRNTVKTADSESQTITIRGWAEVFWIGRVPNRAAFDTLEDLHLWDKPLVDMRFNYRPDYPLYVIIVRGWVLPQPVTMALDDQYAGCKSWVHLPQNIALDGSTTALPDGSLQSIQTRIVNTFGTTVKK